MKKDFYSEITANQRMTYVMICVFVLFVGLLGYIFSYATGWGVIGFPIAIVIAIIISVNQYYNGDKMVLKISKARPAKKEEFPRLINTVEGLSIAAGVPMPKIYVIDDEAPNAFATGRDPEHSSVAVTTGLLEKMNRTELEGVIAHEMSHVKNYDIRIMTISVALVGVVILVSNFMLRSFMFGGGRRRKGKSNAIMFAIAIVMAILAPLFATMIRLAISRKREFLADASAAKLTRYPDGLANALKKISADHSVLKVANKATAPLYISNPLKKNSTWTNLFSTHPPAEERIKRLRAM